MSSNTLTVQLTPDDYIAANRLHGSLKWQLLIFAIAALVIVAIPYFENTVVHLDSDVLIPLALFSILFFSIRYIVLPWRTRKIFRQQKSMHRPYSMSWDDELVSIQGDEYSARTPWTDYLKWREGNEIFLMYLSDVMFRIVPKRAFQSDAEINAFRAVLQKKISMKEGKRRS